MYIYIYIYIYTYKSFNGKNNNIFCKIFCTYFYTKIEISIYDIYYLLQ